MSQAVLLILSGILLGAVVCLIATVGIFYDVGTKLGHIDFTQQRLQHKLDLQDEAIAKIEGKLEEISKK